MWTTFLMLKTSKIATNITVDNPIPESLSSFQILLAFAFSYIFKVCFSPKVQTGQAGSYLLISDVTFSKHSAWKTWPQTRTATTSSFNSFAHTAHVWRLKEGEPKLRLVTLSRWKPKDSLSNDHLSLRGFDRSAKAGTDQPSDDPPWEPLVESLPQPGSTKEDDSSEIENVGDFSPGTRRSGTCRPRRFAEEWWGKLGVKLAGSSWLRGDKGDADKDETEGADGDSFPGEGNESADEPSDSLT